MLTAQYDKAIKKLEHALETGLSELGVPHLLIASCYNALGLV